MKRGYDDLGVEVKLANGQQRTSKNTCVNSLPAVAKLAEKLGAWEDGSANLDLGAGRFHRIADYLVERGVTSLAYDPFWVDAETNAAAMEPSWFDTATCSNVLNVIDSHDARIALLDTAHEMLLPGGKLYITVYEGNRTGQGSESKADCWQENRPTADYVHEIEISFGEDNVVRKGKLIIATKGSK